MKRIGPLPSLILAAAAAHAQAPAFRGDLDAGRYLKVLGESEALLRKDPGNAQAWAAKAQALASFQRLQEALEAAERSLQLRPGNPDGLLARGLARAGIAVQQRSLSSIRNASGAMDDLRGATVADPNLAAAWTSLGLAYEELPGVLGGSTKQALACADRLRRLDPARGDVLAGRILAQEGRWAEAEPFFGRALAVGPGDPQVVSVYLDALGGKETRKRLGEAEQKARLAREARRLLPSVAGRAKGVEACSQALLDAGEHEAAWKVAQEALSRVEAPSILKLHLGKLSARTGVHREEGLAYLDQVLGKEPLEGGTGGLPAAHWRRGQILKDMGRRDEARREAQLALQQDPNHTGARRLLKEVS